MATPDRVHRPDREPEFRLGEWRIAPQSGEISSGDRSLRLEPKVMLVLEYLAGRPHEVVAKQELLDEVWPDCFVTEDVLWRSVSELRRALGDDSRSPRFIETLPRRGYRLVATPRPMAPDPRSPERGRSWWRLPVAAALLSIVVATTVLWLGAPVSETRAVAAPPAELPLVDASRVDGLYGQALEYYWSEDRTDIERAIGLYRRALAIEPDHAPSLAGLANAYTILETHHGAGAEWVDMGIETARRAVAARPDSAEAYRSLAIAYHARGRLADAIAADLRAIELRPDYSAAIGLLAGMYRRIGDLEASAHWFARLRSEPREERIHFVGRGRTLALLGDLSGAREAYSSALAVEPFQPFATALLVRLDILEGEIEQGRARLAEVLEVHPGSAVCLRASAELEHVAGDRRAAREALERALGAGGFSASIVIRQAALLAEDGEAERAAARLRSLGAIFDRPPGEGWEPAYDRAAAESVLGDRSAALGWLQRAVEAGYRDASWLAIDPVFASLAGDQRFAGLLADIEARVSSARRVARVDAVHVASATVGERRVGDSGL